MMYKRNNAGRKGMMAVHRAKKIVTVILTVLAILCMILGAAIVTFKTTGLRFCTVDGHSMDNTLFDGEQLLLNPSADPRFGDVIVFDYGGTYLVKRVIGLPGDTVNVVWVELCANNIKYKENYLSPECVVNFMDSTFTVTVGENEYFVMGDNRDNSRDGRSFGCIPKDTITGVAIWHF